VVPGAKVTIKSVDTEVTRELTTNEAGQYRAVPVPIGRYEVTVEASGFATAKLADIALTVGSARSREQAASFLLTALPFTPLYTVPRCH
jgi:hypothetical protein